MGRKIEIKKIEDHTKCQVTFSKRRTSLIKKADEISLTCDVDVLLVAFSPSGRISTFCSLERTEDFLENYANLTVEKRISHMKNIQKKVEKLKSLDNIRNEEGKLYYLNNQIKNLEMQIKNQQIEVQLAEANVRDFELKPGQEASLHQLSWCERNLKQSCEKIKEIKKEKLATEKEGKMQMLRNNSGNSLHFAGSSSEDRQQQMQFAPWSNNQYIYPENIFNEVLEKGKGKEVAYAYGVPAETAMLNNISYVPTPTSYNMGQLGFPENLAAGLSYNLWQKNNCNAQLPSSYAMSHPRIAVAGDAPNQLIYAPSQGYQSGMQAPIPYPQLVEPSFRPNFDGESSNFTQNHLSEHFLPAFPHSNPNHAKSTGADAGNYWDVPIQHINQPNTVLGNTDNDNNKENHDVYNEIIISPPPADPAPHFATGNSNDLHDFFPSQDPLGDNAPGS